MVLHSAAETLRLMLALLSNQTGQPHGTEEQRVHDRHADLDTFMQKQTK